MVPGDSHKMNKIAYLFIIVLASCQFIPVQTNMTSIPPISDVLEFSEKCPHLCWLGINPGTTTTEQATAWLRSSDQIDQKTAQISEASFLATWFPGKQVNNPCVLEVDFEAGLVKSITLGSLLYTVDDVISAFGPPDEISVTEIKAEGIRFLHIRSTGIPKKWRLLCIREVKMAQRQMISFFNYL